MDGSGSSRRSSQDNSQPEISEQMEDWDRALGSLKRLFDSQYFTMNMALDYLETKQDSNIQQYLCMKFLQFPRSELEFYLPQLIAIYSRNPGQYTYLRTFFISYSRKDIQFASHLCSLLQAEMPNITLHNESHLALKRLFHHILCTDLDSEVQIQAKKIQKFESSSTPSSPARQSGHRRVQSEVVQIHPDQLRQLREAVVLSSASESSDSSSSSQSSKLDVDAVSKLGRNFQFRIEAPHTLTRSSSSSWMHDEEDKAVARIAKKESENLTIAQFLSQQTAFLDALMDIGERLRKFSGKDARRTQLFAELSMLNLSLPSRVYLPLQGTGGPSHNHHIVRIAPQEALTLNSKDRAPFMIQVEVVECDNFALSPVPGKLNLVREQTKHLRSFSDGDTPSEKSEHVVVPASRIRQRLHEASQDKHLQFAKTSSDPSAVKAKEPWEKKRERIRKTSPYGHLSRWKLIPVIVKSGDDLRQEMLASQLLKLFQRSWQEEGLSLWLRPFQIMVTCQQGGLIEVIDSAVSLHQTKQKAGDSLFTYFVREHGEPATETFATAQKNFVESLAGYSLFCYFGQVKDRHNGNILIDSEGHLIHIDFGFFLSNSPGRNMGFESAPFKLLPEFVEVMGGEDSDMFKYFQSLIFTGFMAARKHMEKFVTVVKTMQKGSDLPCFVKGEETVRQFESRFERSLTDDALEKLTQKLIRNSLGSTRTRLYDNFQYYTNGIL